MRTAVTAMMLSLTISAEVFLLAFDNKPMAWAMAAQLGVLLLSLIVSTVVFKRRM